MFGDYDLFLECKITGNEGGGSVTFRSFALKNDTMKQDCKVMNDIWKQESMFDSTFA